MKKHQEKSLVIPALSSAYYATPRDCVTFSIYNNRLQAISIKVKIKILKPKRKSSC